MNVKWLEWAKQIQAIAQTGLTYTKDVYDRERYDQLMDLGINIVSTYTNAPEDKIKLLFANETGYATPKVDVRGVVFKNDKLLLVKEVIDGKWALPGGWADIGFSASEVVKKEISEEAGLIVKPVKLLGLLDKKFYNHPPELYHVYKVFIRCEIIGGAMHGGLETTAVDFFSEDELPVLSTERNTLEQIKLMFEFLRNPERPSILD